MPIIVLLLSNLILVPRGEPGTTTPLAALLRPMRDKTLFYLPYQELVFLTFNTVFKVKGSGGERMPCAFKLCHNSFQRLHPVEAEAAKARARG